MNYTDAMNLIQKWEQKLMKDTNVMEREAFAHAYLVCQFAELLSEGLTIDMMVHKINSQIKSKVL